MISPLKGGVGEVAFLEPTMSVDTVKVYFHLELANLMLTPIYDKIFERNLQNSHMDNYLSLLLSFDVRRVMEVIGKSFADVYASFYLSFVYFLKKYIHSCIEIKKKRNLIMLHVRQDGLMAISEKLRIHSQLLFRIETKEGIK